MPNFFRTSITQYECSPSIRVSPCCGAYAALGIANTAIFSFVNAVS